MITKIKAEIIYNNNFQMEDVLSKLEKFLFSLVSDEYKMILNTYELKPYSCNFQKDGGKYFWIINTLTKEARDYIALPFIKNDKDSNFIEYNNEIIKIKDIEVVQTTYDSLISKNYLTKEKNNYITINFKTPTAFKSYGQYIFYPDISLIYKSIIRKYNEFSLDYEIDDEEVLNFIVENTKVIDYKLKSTRFHLVGNRIPSFIGNIRIKIIGPETNKNLINLLLNFGEYSGVGIKTALGMGAIEIKY